MLKSMRSGARLKVQLVGSCPMAASPPATKGQPMWISNQEGKWDNHAHHNAIDDVVCDAWANHVRSEGLRVAQWGRVTGIHTTKNIIVSNNPSREEGALLRCGEAIETNPGHLQWNIFFVARTGIDIRLFEERIKAHPFVEKAERQDANTEIGNIGDH